MLVVSLFGQAHSGAMPLTNDNFDTVVGKYLSNICQPKQYQSIIKSTNKPLLIFTIQPTQSWCSSTFMPIGAVSQTCFSPFLTKQLIKWLQSFQHLAKWCLQKWTVIKKVTTYLLTCVQSLWDCKLIFLCFSPSLHWNPFPHFQVPNTQGCEEWSAI